MHLNVEFTSFQTRLQRARYIASRYAERLEGAVLDVGCDSGVLKTLLPAADYIGIDAAGSPDLLINLEKIKELPFETDSFDCVVCTDVLEHLDNFHAVFDELLRVSRRSVILSLPNCWSSARQPIQRGRGHFLHYGLPIEPPQDRHKWFFNITDAIDFLEGQKDRVGFTIRELHVTEKPRAWYRSIWRRLIYMNQRNYLNRYAHTLWAVLEKTPSAAGQLRRVA